MLLAAFYAACAFAQDSTQPASGEDEDIDINAMARAKDAPANPPDIRSAPAAKTAVPASPPNTQSVSAAKTDVPAIPPNTQPVPAVRTDVPASPPNTQSVSAARTDVPAIPPNTQSVPAARTDVPAIPPNTQSVSAARTDTQTSLPNTQRAPAAKSDTASGHPAPLAQPSSADKERATTCTILATHLLDAVQKADYVTATRDFDDRMREALPPDRFKEIWESLPPRFGILQTRGQSHASMDQGYIAISTPLTFEKANLYAQIACGTDNHIAGFYVKPLPAPGS
jgi:hypothetical protein